MRKINAADFQNNRTSLSGWFEASETIYFNYPDWSIGIIEPHDRVHLKNGIIHHDTEPALFHLDQFGNRTDSTYFYNGVYHREDGPAVQIYYYLYGVYFMTEQEFTNAVRSLHKKRIMVRSILETKL